MRESKIEAYLVKKVKAMGGECRKLRWIGRNGAPDRVVMLRREITLLHGVLRTRGSPAIWVELKATGKKPTAAQLREHLRMEKMGQRVEVIDSIEGVDKLLC